MSYDYQTFWKEEGKKPVGRLEPRFLKHKEILPFYLNQMDFDTVLEIGPGDGRITELILDNRDLEKYDGIDISQDRIDMLKKTCPQVKCENKNIVTEPISNRYDLVISVECLLHIKPEDIEQVLKKMVAASSKYIINIDFNPKHDESMAFYNFIHDYESIYKKLGVKLRKHRIDDEVLFIAYKD